MPWEWLLKKGRDMTEHDTPESMPVMLINETMARTLWPGEDPIGKAIVGGCAKERVVVGVVADVRHMALEKDSGSEMYLPMRQCPDYGSWDLVVRSGLPFLCSHRAWKPRCGPSRRICRKAACGR